MRKTLLLVTAVIALTFAACPLTYAAYNPDPYARDDGDSLEDLKAKARQEVRDEMGLKKTPLPPNPASPKDTTRPRKKIVKRPASSKNSIEIPMPFDMSPDVAFRMAFIIMFFSIIPAVIARTKGRSFIAWWVLSCLFFVIVLPISIFMGNKKPLEAPPKKRPVQKEPDPEVKVERTWDKPVKSEETGTPMPEPNENSAIEVYAKIENLAKLRDKGVITEEEFKSKKNDLLSRI